MQSKVMVSPSILASDFSGLDKAFNDMKNAGAEMAHIDVMDGVFVPNISIGIPVVKSLRPKSDLIFDVHLMITDPIKYVKDFADAGADIITFHVESQSDVGQTVREIKKLGKKAGIALRPKTPASVVFPYLNEVDMVLVMTVEPGFGGQKFMHDMMPKLKQIKEECEKRNLDILLQVDGGVDNNTAPIVKENGANVLVAGTYFFKAENKKEAADLLR